MMLTRTRVAAAVAAVAFLFVLPASTAAAEPLGGPTVGASGVGITVTGCHRHGDHYDCRCSCSRHRKGHPCTVTYGAR